MKISLPSNLVEFTQFFTTLLFGLGVMCYVAPYFLIGIPFMAYIFYRVRNMYRKSSREIKRLEGTKFQHFSKKISFFSV